MTTVTLAKVATVISKGTTPTSVGLAFATTGVPFIRSEDITSGSVDISETSLFISSASHRLLRRSALQQGDVLVTIAGTIGKIGYVGESGKEANCNQAVAFVRCRPSEVDAEWLCRLLQSPDYQARFSDFVAGGAIPNVSLRQLGSLEIPKLSLDEQRRVAARLRVRLAEVDAARHAAQAQAADIALLRRRVLAELFAAVSDAPRERLGEHATTTSGSTPPRGVKAYWTPAEVPWVKTGEVAFAPITGTEEAISRRALDECSLTLLPPKSVLLAITGQGKTRGRSAVLEISAANNQHSVAILPNELWLPEYLQLWLESSYLDLRELSEGRGGSRSALSGAQVDDLLVHTPDRTQQAALARRAQAALREIDALAAANLAQRQELDRLPQRLLAQAFDLPRD